ncbi:AraC family transcriptional regulator [Alicyclobacillus sp. SO9]|uniref:AraC family transcriptional regulator n=1 Tax=Alicyclobacillus sp. SO9 TaxID=2665646 RepID=UPI0018E83865|nr:AraC family transcriptional regulator [Alicyclobacillus sp. SO9]QQE77893.1 AraC family transcriptional regulator [Alicyclobacillus sp. SO9]
MGQPNALYEYMMPNMDSTFRLFAAHLRSVDSHWKYPKHTDTLFEINLVVEGQQTMVVNGKRYVQDPGDLLLLKPKDIHQAQCSKGSSMTYYCLHFDVDYRPIRELLYSNECIFYRHDSVLAQEIDSVLKKLIDITVCKDEHSVAQRMSALATMFELFAKLSDALSGQTDARPHSAGAMISRQIADALDAYVDKIDQEEEQPKDIVHQISLDLGYSVSTCGRIFQEVYGMSPRQYLSAVKLRKAKLLLIESDMTVETISRKLGYGDIAHFSRQFKRWTGQSPRSFRVDFQ